jgi:hypothetical protein
MFQNDFRREVIFLRDNWKLKKTGQDCEKSLAKGECKKFQSFLQAPTNHGRLDTRPQTMDV